MLISRMELLEKILIKKKKEIKVQKRKKTWTKESKNLKGKIRKKIKKKFHHCAIGKARLS